MTNQIVECVANFSDARRPQVIEAIKDAIRSVSEVIVLDQHSDLDHNRTVLTFVGPPGPIETAAFAAIAKAAELIDLDEHRGEHPRIGASDVVPFVPISGVTMAECVAIARHLGQRVGEELGIPVYLYEEAATRPDRQSLENIRRGQYEGLKEEILINPERQPDFGPARLDKAGATVSWGAPAACCIQCLSRHRRCQHRQEDCQNHSFFWRWFTLRKGIGAVGRRPRPDLDELDQFSQHSSGFGRRAYPP